MGYDDSVGVRWRNRLAAQFEAAYLVNSEAIRAQMIACEHVGPEHIAVVYNPINQERLSTGMAGPLERERWGLAAGDLGVGIVANIRPVKDYETFLKAAVFVAERVPNINSMAVGSTDREYWEKLRPKPRKTPR